MPQTVPHPPVTVTLTLAERLRIAASLHITANLQEALGEDPEALQSRALRGRILAGLQPPEKMPAGASPFRMPAGENGPTHDA